jgi:RimJ/RimL family protein N-acetyltransferase
LETARLRLREFTASDLREVVAMYRDPEVVRFWPQAPDDAEIETQLYWLIDRYAVSGWGGWRAELHDGTFAGRIGLNARSIDGADEVEVGYILRRELWGRGLATEGAAACIGWAFEHLDVPRVISLIRPDNARSIAVATRNGLRPGGETSHGGMLHRIYAIDRQTWKRRTRA